MDSAAESLDRLIDALSAKLDEESPPRDAIDAALNDTPRTTHVQTLRNHPDLARFRQELADGLIRVDTANRALQLLSNVVTARLAS